MVMMAFVDFVFNSEGHEDTALKIQLMYSVRKKVMMVFVDLFFNSDGVFRLNSCSVRITVMAFVGVS